MFGLRQNPAINKLAQQSPSNYPDYLRPQRSNPYNDYCQIFNSCSEKIQFQILQDPHFLEKYTACENLIKQFLFPQVIPEILQTQEGRIVFEELLACTQALKNHYTQEAVNEEQKKENQAQEIQDLKTQIRKMESYMAELLAQKTEPPTPIAQPTQTEGITNAAATE